MNPIDSNNVIALLFHHSVRSHGLVSTFVSFLRFVVAEVGKEVEMSDEEEGTASSESPEATETQNPVEESEDEEVILNTNAQNRRGRAKAVEPSPIDLPKSNRSGQSKKTNQDLPLVGGSASTKKVNTGKGQSKTSTVKTANQVEPAPTAEKRKLPRDRKTNKENAEEDLSVESANASETQVNTRRGRSKPTAVDPEPEIVAAVSRNVQTRRGRRKEVLQDDEPIPDEQPTPSIEPGNTRRGSSKAVEPGNASKQANVSEKRKTPRGKKEDTEHLDIPMKILKKRAISYEQRVKRGL